MKLGSSRSVYLNPLGFSRDLDLKSAMSAHDPSTGPVRLHDGDERVLREPGVVVQEAEIHPSWARERVTQLKGRLIMEETNEGPL